jgi:DNA (cytosine-5)-methyltransferase 1
MSQGLKQAGYDVIGAVELDSGAAGVYRLNHPTVTVWNSDIEDVTVKDVLRKLRLKSGQLDLLGGCPPCQGFSTLRTLNGNRRVRDKQNDLIFEFERLALGLMPRAIMLENVPRLRENWRLVKFKSDLENAGYIVKVGVLNVADYGVPQRRNRLVLIASLTSSPHLPGPARRIRTVRDAIASLKRAGRSGDPLHDLPVNYSPRVRELIANIPRNGGSRSSLPERLRLKCHDKRRGFHDVYGRMAWNKPAPTITTGCFNPSRGRFLHPSSNRAITMREAALLQSFPKSYIFPVQLGKVRIAAMIGNALPPQFIRRLAQRLLRPV